MLNVIFLYTVSISLLFQPVLVLAQYSEKTYYTAIQTELNETQAGVTGVCTDCLKEDSAVREIQNLKVATCEEIVNSPRCKEISDKKYLRDCKAEEEDLLALGNRVRGCLFGATTTATVGTVIGTILGVITAAFGMQAVAIPAGIGGALYLYTEYNRIYTETGGPDRITKTLNQMLSSIGSSLYRLFMQDYECYNPEGRAWQMCGLLAGLSTGGFSALGSTGVRSSVSRLSSQKIMQRILGRKFTSEEIEALTSAQTGGLLDPRGISMGRFLEDLRGLKQAGFKLSEIEQLVEKIKIPFGVDAKKIGPQWRKEFLDNIRSASRAVKRPNGFSVDELDTLARSQGMFRNGFSDETKSISLHHVNDALESIKAKGFDHSDIGKILDNKVLFINSETEQAARMYMRNLDNVRGTLGNGFSSSNQALRTAQEKFSKMAVDEKKMLERIAPADQSGKGGLFLHAIQSYRLNRLSSFRRSRIKDSLLSLEQAGYDRRSIMVMLDNDLLVTDRGTKKIIENYLERTL